MKNNFFNLLAIALLLTSFACSNPESENLAEITTSESFLDVTSRGNDAEEKEDMLFLLARKWVTENASVFIELKIDGSFEGNISTENLVSGTWELSEDQKILKLKGSEGEEGKGRVFKGNYTVVEMSFDALKLKDEKGKMYSLTATK